MITCYIYRCSAKQDMYIYLSEKDDFDSLPDELRKNLGILEFTMELELDADKNLAKEDALTVMENLKSQGFHLQLPSNTSIDELLEKIAQQALKN